MAIVGVGNEAIQNKKELQGLLNVGQKDKTERKVTDDDSSSSKLSNRKKSKNNLLLSDEEYILEVLSYTIKFRKFYRIINLLFLLIDPLKHEL